MLACVDTLEKRKNPTTAVGIKMKIKKVELKSIHLAHPAHPDNMQDCNGACRPPQYDSATFDSGLASDLTAPPRLLAPAAELLE
jgi:hypothetical protein